MYTLVVSFKRFPVMLSLLLIMIIGYSVYSYSPDSILYDPPTYNETSWSRHVNPQYLTYRSLKGTLRLAEISNKIRFHTSDGIEYRTYNTTYYALDTGNDVYYLTQQGREPLINGDLKIHIEDPILYLNGNYFKYSHPNGPTLNYIHPIEYSEEPLIDLGDRAANIVCEILGDNYFKRYFKKPIIWKDESDPEETYSVSYLYNSSQDNRDRYISLFFNNNKLLVNQEELPDNNSKLPFTIPREEAKNIAISNGLQCNESSTVSLEMINGIDDWFNQNGTVPIETYFNSKYSANEINLTRYLWKVNLHSEIYTEEEYTIVHFALIDVNTGDIILVDDYQVSWHPWWGL